jgi:two-component system response regulator QseB
VSSPRLLLVEDDPELGAMLTRLLREEGYTTTLATNGQRGLHLVLTQAWDVIILDRGLPVVDGLEVLQIARERGVLTPTLILSARGTVDDRVDGLDAGASDYLTKPFSIEELLARLRSLRRHHLDDAEVLPLGVRFLDVAGRVVLGDPEVTLTAQETALLAHLARTARRVHSRADLLEEVFPDAQTDAALDSYVSYLRRKLGKGCIETTHGVGYRLGSA